MMQGRDSYSFQNWGDLGLPTQEKKEIRLRSFKSISEEVQDKENVENDKEKEDGSENESYKSRFKRTIIIEPVMMMLFMFHMSSVVLINSQYIYHAIGEKYNLSALLKAEKEEKNGTEGDKPGGDGGPCGGGGTGDENSTSEAFIAQQKAQADAAMFNFYMDLVSDVPGFFLVLFFGTLMDQYGRKPAMIIPMVGIILRAITYPVQMVTGLPLEFLFLSGLLDTFSGGGITLMTAAYAFYADTIPAERRGRRLIITDVIFGISFSLMSFAMGFMIEAWGFFWPYIFVICGHCVNLFYIIFFVPESLKPTGKKKERISPMYMITSFKVFGVRRPSGGRKLLAVFTLVWSFAMFARYGLRHVDSLYRLNTPFCWSPTMLSTYSSVSFLVLMLFQLLFGLVLIKPLGNITIILISILSGAAQLLVTGLASNNLTLWMALLVGFASSCLSPVMRAIFSELVDLGEQGALNSSISSIDKIAGLVSSFFFSFVYSSTLYTFSGTVFIIAACMMLVSLLMLVIFKVMYNGVEKKKEAIKAQEEIPQESKTDISDP